MADQETLPRSEHPAAPRAVADGEVSVAVLDRTGVIVAVNQVWVDFCRANGGRLDACGPGTSYLDACAAGGDATSAAVAAAIQEATRGDVLRASRVRISCHSPAQQRWFDVVISSALAPDASMVSGATVMLVPAPPPAPQQPADPTARLTGLTAELHEEVVREVYGTTLSICSVLDRVTDPLARDRIHRGVDTLDQTLARLRRIAAEIERA